MARSSGACRGWLWRAVWGRRMWLECFAPLTCRSWWSETQRTGRAIVSATAAQWVDEAETASRAAAGRGCDAASLRSVEDSGDTTAQARPRTRNESRAAGRCCSLLEERSYRHHEHASAAASTC